MKKFPTNTGYRIARILGMWAVAIVMGTSVLGCESVPTGGSNPPFSDITCKMVSGEAGHYETQSGVPICSIYDANACGGKPDECGYPSFGTCRGSKVEGYTCAPDRAEGTACVYAAQCGTRNCLSGICGQPSVSTPDLGTTPSPTDMAGCSFQTQQPCPAGRACLPQVGQGADIYVCTPSYPIEVKLYKVERGSVECWSEKGVSGRLLETIKPVKEIWIGCPVGTQSIRNESGTDSELQLKFPRPGTGGVNSTIVGNGTADLT